MYEEKLPIGLTHQEIEGDDGQCFYSAVALFLGMSCEDYQTIRDMVADELLSDNEQYKESFVYDPDDAEPYDTFEDFISAVRESKWADYLEILALTNVLKRKIWIVNDKYIWPIGQERYPESETIFIGQRENHFDALLKTPNAQNEDIENYLRSRWAFNGCPPAKLGRSISGTSIYAHL